MRLVSNLSEQQIATAYALDAVEDGLRHLAANIMRVTAGGGRAYELAQQATQFVAACVAFREAAKVYPSSFQLEAMLVKPKPDPNIMERSSEEDRGEDRAIEVIETGTLRAVAARLVGPRVQEIRGSHLIYEGINTILVLRRERDAKLGRSQRAAATVRKKPTQKRAKRTEPAAKP